MKEINGLCFSKRANCVISLLCLSACGGTKVLTEPLDNPVTVVLSTTSDQSLEAGLQWVIIRDGPGSWAAKADWDQYLLHFANLSNEPIRVSGVTLVDSLGTRIKPRITRNLLVKGSKKAAARYDQADIPIHAGMSGAGLLATGTAMAAIGGYVTAYSIIGLMAGTTSGVMLAPAAYLAMYAAPVAVAGSVVVDGNQRKLSTEIINRQTLFPHVIPAKTAQPVSIFYPITPAPISIEINYKTTSGSHTLILDAREALDGLHLESLTPDDIDSLREAAAIPNGETP